MRYLLQPQTLTGESGAGGCSMLDCKTPNPVFRRNERISTPIAPIIPLPGTVTP